MNCKTLGIIILLFLHTIMVDAQAQGDAASRNQGDTASVNALLQQSKEMLSDDPTKAINLANQAKVLAEKIDFQKGKGYALKFIGLAYASQGVFQDALVSWDESLQIFETLKDETGIANLLNNIGGLYADQGNEEKGLEFCLRSLKLSEKLGDTLRILSALNTVGTIYFDKKATWDKAVKYFLQALTLSEAIGDKDAIGFISANIGEIYLYQNDFIKSKSFFEKTIKALGDAPNSSFAYSGIGKIYLMQGDFAQALNYNNKSLAIAEKTKSKPHIVRAFQGIANVYIAKKDYLNALTYFNKASTLAEEVKAPLDLKDIYRGMAVAYAKIADYKEAFKFQTLYASIKDTLYNIDTDKKLGKLQFEFDLQKKEGEISLLTKDKALQDADLKRQKLAKNAFAAGLGLVFLIAVIIFRNYREKVKINKILDEQKVQIENLLLNILPSEVAKELQQKGQATPRNFELVSVMFTDFKSFTIHADKLSPQELVEELNTCFIAFDNIIEKYGLEKIKTIGDSYMCAGGIPTPDKRHVHNMVSASLEIQEYIVVNNKRKIADGQEPWDLRIGVHVGPVVAGVVGKKKYAYDIWGSTVNIASRLESNGEPEQVNISASVYEIVKNDFTCSYRGKIYAKNVGDVDMYFVASSSNKLADKVSASTFSI
jgi:adenylate cyclase